MCCRYKVDSQPLEAKGLISDYRIDYQLTHFKVKIGQYHDLQLALYPILNRAAPLDTWLINCNGTGLHTRNTFPE